MSVTTSSASVIEPPPLLFGQRSPSPPSFSSPPQSPNHIQHSQAPIASPPPLPTQDVDMNASVTIPPPDGQNHDREDAVMEDPGGQTNGHLELGTSHGELPGADVAVEVAAVDEDAMDTALDNVQGLVLPNGSADPQEPTGNNPSSPAPNGVTQDTTELDPQQQQQAPTTTGENVSAPPHQAMYPLS